MAITIGRVGFASALLATTCASVRQPAVVIPFDFVKHQIIVRTSINGHGPYSMLLDTLVSPSVLDSNAARDAGVPIDLSHGGEAEGVGSGHATIHAATIPSLAIGNVSFGDVEAVSSDMTQLGARLGVALHGVLGYSFLRDKVITIDYPARQLYINADDQRPKRSRTDVVAVRFTITADDLLTLPSAFSVNGMAIPVSIDTGSSLTLDLYRPAIERLHLAAGPTSTITGARGDAVVHQSTVQSIGIGDLKLNNPEVSLSDRKDFGSDREGNVGNGFLEHFIVTIDYRSRKFILQKP